MIFKFDFIYQLKLPTLVLPKLHFSLNQTVRHEVSGFCQTKTHQHIHENKVKSFILDVTPNFKWGLRNISRVKNNNWTKKNRQKLKKTQQACKDMKPPVINIKQMLWCIRSSAGFMWADWSVINNCHINRQRWWEKPTVPSILQLQHLIVNDHKSNFLSRKQETLGLVAGGRCVVPPKMGRPQWRFYCCLKYYFV